MTGEEPHDDRSEVFEQQGRWVTGVPDGEGRVPAGAATARKRVHSWSCPRKISTCFW